jgi:hypothetical protein
VSRRLTVMDATVPSVEGCDGRVQYQRQTLSPSSFLASTKASMFEAIADAAVDKDVFSLSRAYIIVQGKRADETRTNEAVAAGAILYNSPKTSVRYQGSQARLSCPRNSSGIRPSLKEKSTKVADMPEDHSVSQIESVGGSRANGAC